MRKFTFFLALVMLMVSKLAAQTILVPYKSTWKYLDNGSNQGTAWRATSFDDGSWKSGPAILGYGNPPYNNRKEATVVSKGPYTTYFRKSITLASVAESFQFSIRRDDGVVVYVNGVEVIRNFMPSGIISYNTPALFSQDNGIVPQVFKIPGSAFIPGTNVIAVEIHQLKSPDSDMTFDLELVGTGGTTTGDVTPPTVLSLNRHTPATQTTNATSLTFRTTFSEAATGVDMSDFVRVGTSNGTISGVIAVSGTTYDVTVNGISINGTVGLNLKSSGTGIADAAGNPISGGFTGQTYTIDQTPADQTPPTVLSLNRQSPTTATTSATAVIFRATFSEAVTGVDMSDFVRVGTSNGTISGVVAVSGTTYDVTVNGISINGTIGLNLKSSGTGIADAAGNPISGGFTGQTYTIDQTPADQTPPTVLSLSRQSPTTATTSATAVIFRATFSEAVTGVNATDFALALSGSATGTIGAVTPVGTGSITYDVAVNGISGSGTLGLNLKASGTGIADAAANPISGGFTGQVYTIQPVPVTYGFASLTNLTPFPSPPDATKGRPQAKIFTNAGKHWAIIASAGGTYLWRLDGRSWTNILKLSARNTRADCIVDGNVTHIFLFAGKNSELVSVEYDPAAVTYLPWSKRNTKVDLVLDDGIETGTIARDGTGRLWLASDAVTDINVRYSDAPYTSWSAPITIGAGIDSDDVSAIIAMPGKIGVLWGNQQTERFGFRTHTDGQDPATWSADEMPASQSALNQGKGMADDHLDMKVTSDGTLYCAVKTGYDEPGYTKIALLIRRPTGTWDNLYGVSEEGTAPIVVVNEALGKVKVIYSSQTYGGDILYKETSMFNISFGRELTLISGVNNYATSSHQLYATEVVILASNTEQTTGVLASDVPLTSQTLSNDQAARMAPVATVETQQQIQAFPNPVTTNKATIRFALATDGPYTFTLHESETGRIVYQQQGAAQAGKQNSLELESSRLSGGVYFARLQTNDSIKTLRLFVNK